MRVLFVRGNRVVGGGRDADRSGASRSLATTVPWYGWARARVRWPGVKRLALILILTLSATTASAVPTAAQDDQYTDPFAWKKCSAKVSSSLKITAARRMRCKAAKRVMRRYDGSISRKFSTAGFKCKRVKGRAVSGIWRCKKGTRKAFRFAFRD
jgi:hypothetical protein